MEDAEFEILFDTDLTWDEDDEWNWDVTSVQAPNLGQPRPTSPSQCAMAAQPAPSTSHVVEFGENDGGEHSFGNGRCGGSDTMIWEAEAGLPTESAAINGTVSMDPPSPVAQGMPGSRTAPGHVDIPAVQEDVNSVDNDTELLEELRAQNIHFINKMKSKSTVHRTESVINRLMEWIRKKGELRALKDIPKATMDQLLALWLSDIRKPSGHQYEPGTLSSYFSSVKCHFTEIGLDANGFDISEKVLRAKKKDLKSKGKGNTPNRSTTITPEDEAKLWESGALGSNDPEALIHTIWYLFTKCFGFRGCNEARQLKWGDVTKTTTQNGSSYLEWNERLTKTRAGNSSHQRAFAPKLFENVENPDRCPIRLFHKYESLRRDNCEAFFQGINYKRPNDQSEWYIPIPMGVNRVAQIMPRIAKRAGLTGRFTNHSVRRAMCTQLFQQGVPPVMIAQLSGHKNVNSLSHYTTASEQQQKHMCAMLQNPPVSRSMMTNPISNPQAVSPLSVRDSSPRKLMCESAARGSEQNAMCAAGSSSMQSARGLMGLMSGSVFNGPVSIHFHVNEKFNM